MPDFNAFDLIRDGLFRELEQQGFHEAQPLEEEAGRAEMFATEDVAYSLLYDKKQQRFELRSATLNDKGEAEKWRSLSLWLYDEEQGERADAESILNDFLDVVRGPKRVAVVQQQKKKRGKDDERSVDPLFFLNRLIGLFPELREEMNDERIVYGQIRYVTFARERVVPRVEDLMARYADSQPAVKLASLFDDMYRDGDLDLRSLLTAVILNGLSDSAFSALQEKMGDELKKASSFSRKLKGKKIKPEKVKKGQKVEARLE